MVVKAFLALGLLLSAVLARADVVVLEEVVPQSGDRWFVEFRASAKSSFLESGHASVVIGIERGRSTYFNKSFGFYPHDGSVKSIYYVPGNVLFNEEDLTTNDKAFRAYVTADQARRVEFAAKHIETQGKIYSLPLQTCVSFAMDLASVIGLKHTREVPQISGNPSLFFEPFELSPILPNGLIEDLRKHNSPVTPLEQEVARRAAREPDIAKRYANFRMLLATTPTGAPINSVAISRMEEMRGAGVSSPGFAIGGPGGMSAWEGQAETLLQILSYEHKNK